MLFIKLLQSILIDSMEHYSVLSIVAVVAVHLLSHVTHKCQNSLCYESANLLKKMTFHFLIHGIVLAVSCDF